MLTDVLMVFQLAAININIVCISFEFISLVKESKTEDLVTCASLNNSLSSIFSFVLSLYYQYEQVEDACNI